MSRSCGSPGQGVSTSFKIPPWLRQLLYHQHEYTISIMKIGCKEDDNNNDNDGNLLNDQSEPGGELFLHLLQLEVLLRALQVSCWSTLVSTIMMIQVLTMIILIMRMIEVMIMVMKMLNKNYGVYHDHLGNPRNKACHVEDVFKDWGDLYGWILIWFF